MYEHSILITFLSLQLINSNVFSKKQLSSKKNQDGLYCPLLTQRAYAGYLILCIAVINIGSIASQWHFSLNANLLFTQCLEAFSMCTD